jgi:CGNR zinc finger
VPELEIVDSTTVVVLVNWFASTCRRASGILDEPLPDTGTVFGVDRRDIDGMSLTNMADALWEVFAARTPADGANLLGDLLVRAVVSPRITAGAALVWHSPLEAPEERFAAAAATKVLTTVYSYGWSRIGVCAATDCADVFIDESSRSGRRYCSSGCLNRSRVRDFRARSSVPGAGKPPNNRHARTEDR